MEDEHFKGHEDLQAGFIGWHSAYKEELIQSLKDKINRGNFDCNPEDNVKVAIIRKHPENSDLFKEDVPDL